MKSTRISVCLLVSLISGMNYCIADTTECCTLGNHSVAYDPEKECCGSYSGFPGVYNKLPPLNSLGDCPDRVPYPNHTPTTNGCSFVPNNPHACLNSGKRVDFKGACDKHDVCYGTCLLPKANCDNWFKADMEAACADQLPGICLCRDKNQCMKTCKDIASEYHLGVVVGGGLAHTSAQKNACQCCP